MDQYPADYIVHNLPLVFLCGLEASTPETPAAEKNQYLGDGGFRIRAELGTLHHPLKEDLRATLLSYDHPGPPWTPQPLGHSEQSLSFRVKSVGRAFTLPPRKAPPPTRSPRLNPDSNTSPPPMVLHSTLSPLSPSSPLYPDGIFTPLWITKHQHRLPSVIVSFYNLVSDSSTSSLEDNKIKTEVNAIRTLITSTNYKTKFVIVLVADGPISNVELEERLVNIRRGTNFDSKALYYLPSTSTVAEIRDFAKVLFSTIHPSAIEYYRDLSKHARRKRNRNVVPQPTVPPHGTTSMLPLSGWNLRYELKLGIFAETRLELEAASKNYEQAYEGLFHAELLGDAISFRSARFNEARMLSDIIALRIIRCSLWSSQASAAVKWWLKHRNRIQDLIERRGKGTNNYAWEAWQSTWSLVMASILDKSQIFQAAAAQLPPVASLPVQLISNKSLANIDRQHPWEHLHHEGYWLDKVQKHIAARREYASELSSEDLDSSKEEKTKSLASPDNYLVPDPAVESQLLSPEGDNYSKRIVVILDRAIEACSIRNQTRMVEALRFQRSKEVALSGDLASASQDLKQLWLHNSWRTQGWWLLLIELGKALLGNQHHQNNDQQSYYSLLWELHAVSRLNTEHFDVPSDAQLSLALDANNSASILSVSFAFSVAEGHVAEPIAVQLTMKSLLPALPFGAQLKEVKVAFDGGIDPILLMHEEASKSSTEKVSIQDLDLVEGSVSGSTNKRLSTSSTTFWTASCDMDLSNAPTKVYNFRVVPREAGPAAATSVVLLVSNGMQEVTFTIGDLSQPQSVWWESRDGCCLPRDFGMLRDVSALTILPKPPKVDLKITNLMTTYYTNEIVELFVDVTNGEDDQITGELTARLISPSKTPIQLQWKHDGTEANLNDSDMQEQAIPPIKVDALQVGASNSFSIMISGLAEPVDNELELKIAYQMGNDSETSLTKQITVDLLVVKPFEANVTFTPRLHEEVWPNFFEPPPKEVNKPHGLKQQYLVNLEMGCFALEPVVVDSLELKSRRIIGGAQCMMTKGRLSASSNEKIGSELTQHEMRPDSTEKFEFDLEIQKVQLGDRSPAAIDFVLEIAWSRPGSLSKNISTLVLPKLLAPMSEPRVLLRVAKLDAPNTRALIYTIENPSMHFLTFNVTMEGTEGIAFSGPRTKTISLVPISRYDIRYHVYMQTTGEWLKIRCEVLDAFFGQTLKIQPASEGVRVDKQGIVQIWSGE